MEAEDPLSELADIHLPGAVSAWPPAPGWWLLAALVLLALALLLRRLLAQRVEQRRQRYAIRELERIHATWTQADREPATRNAAGLEFLYGCNRVLKRVALVFHPSADVANLNGAAWLAFLDRTLGGDDFRQGAGRALGDGAYRPSFDADPDALFALCRRWISQCYRHKGQPPAPTDVGDNTSSNSPSNSSEVGV